MKLANLFIIIVQSGNDIYLSEIFCEFCVFDDQNQQKSCHD